MEVICLEDKAFKALIDKVVTYIKAEHGIKESKWISPEKAMEMGVSEICYTLFRGKLTTLFAGKEMQPML